MDLPVFENVTRPIRASPFSELDFSSIYMMRVFDMLRPKGSQRVEGVRRQIHCAKQWDNRQ
jgi:hypothetical protein